MSDSDPSRGNEYVADVVGIEPDAPFDRVRSLIENLIVWLGQREPVAPGDPFTKFITGGRLVSLGLVTEADIRGDDNEQPDDEDAIEPEMVVVHAREMFPSVTNGCGTLTITELASTKPNLQTLEFVKVGQTSAQFMLIMPPGWVGGSFQFRVYWSHSTGGSTFGTAWRLRAHSVTDGETMSEAFSGSMLVTDTGGTADDLYISPESDPVQISGTQAKAGDLVMCEISRIVTDDGDTLNIPARLHAIRFNVGDAPAEFPPVVVTSHQTYRLYITARNGNPYFTGVGGFECWSGLGGTGTDHAPANQALITFSSVQGVPALSQTNLTDGAYTGSSQYLSQYGSALPHWIRIDFAAAEQVLSFATGAAGDASSIYLRDFLFQYSPDGGTTWFTVLTVTGKSWAASERIVYDLSYPGVPWP